MQSAGSHFEGAFQNISNIFSEFTGVLLGLLDVLIGASSDWDGIKGIFYFYLGLHCQHVPQYHEYSERYCRCGAGVVRNKLERSLDIHQNIFCGHMEQHCFLLHGNRYRNPGLFRQHLDIHFQYLHSHCHCHSDGGNNCIYGNSGLLHCHLTGIYNFFSTIFNAIYNVVSTVFQAIYNVITTVWNAIYTTLEPLITAFGYLFQTIFEAIQIIVGRVMDWISEKISAIWNAIVAFLTPILEGIRTTFETIWNAISTTISTVLTAIQDVVTTVWNAVSGFISSVLSAIWNVVSSIWNSISGTISSVMNAIFSVVSSIWNQISFCGFQCSERHSVGGV